MLEVTKEGEGVELSLELSIGGCYKELDKAGKNGEDDGDGDGVVVVVSESEKFHDESNNGVVFGGGDDQSGSDVVDYQQRKREFHALRRQEARKKKAEKQKRSLLSKGMVNGEDRAYLEAKQFQARAQDRERREKEKTEDFSRTTTTTNNNGDSRVQELNCCVNNPKASNPQLQSAASVNGFGGVFWGQGVGKVEEEDNNVNILFQPLPSRSFRPFHGSSDSGRVSHIGIDSDKPNAVKCRRRPLSNGSLERTSSAFSDFQSTSHKGGCCSTDTGSLSNYSQGCQQQLNASATSDTRERSEINGCSSQLGSEIQANGKTANVNAKLASPNTPTPEGSSELQKQDPVETPTSATSKGSNEVVIKPPKPQTYDQGGATTLPRMPLVSTTGNGPNGRTVNGFLYRYTKTEVSIVCVCHGISFSPAGFVEHAGGIDVSHPLRHITIVPSFG